MARPHKRPTEDDPATTLADALLLPGAANKTHELAKEVPVAMVFDGASAAVMLASPTDISDFAHGFALTEGFITSIDEIAEFELVSHDKGIEARFWLRQDRSAALAARRRSMAGPIGCGLCGLESLDEAARDVPVVAPGALAFTFEELDGATEALRSHQPLHDRTRAVHGAGFIQPGAGIVAAREDVGRHNALDKLFGALFTQGVDPAGGAVVMTSRLSVELVQKCAVMGCPVMIAVSAPTAYARNVGEAAGIMLAAHSHGDGFAVFTHPHRCPALGISP
ncbi:MAG: formate dehydrogenase accessory sulfurtransferase FdhD [Pseudomonadota bacterium]